MATAGRILIIPKGRYNEETQYDMLDMVSHGGKGWICKKTCIGITPEEGEYWAESLNVSEELNGIDSKVTEVNDKVDVATNIAKGRNQAHVFNTTAEMQEWLSDSENKGLLNKGDNIYIVELDVSDWWVAEVLEEADAETGYYYKIAQLETQKVDLSNYIASGTDALVNRLLFSASEIARIYSNNDDVYFVHKGSNGNTEYTGLNELWEHINNKLPKSGGTLTGNVITQSLIPDVADTQKLGSNEVPYAEVRTNMLRCIKSNSTYGYMYCPKLGTASEIGNTLLSVGNATPEGTVGNAKGYLRLFNSGAYYGDIISNNSMTSNQAFTLATKGGTIPSVSLSGTTLTINL